MRIIDYPGSKNFAEEIPDTKWHLPVEKGGLGIGGANANLAVIYVVDAQVDPRWSIQMINNAYLGSKLLQWHIESDDFVCCKFIPSQY